MAPDLQKRLERIDAHVIAPEEYEEAPELTDDELAQADLYVGERLVRRGRPPSPNRKQPVKIRLDPDVVAALRATGPGWQTRINDTLRATFVSMQVRHKVSAPPQGVMIIKRTLRKMKIAGTKGIAIKGLKRSPRTRHTAAKRHPGAKRA